MFKRDKEKTRGKPLGALALSMVLIIMAMFGLVVVTDEVSAATPTVTILHPMEGFMLYGDTMDLNLSVEGFNLTDDIGEPNVAGDGHWELFINGNSQGMFTTENITLTGLPVGDHHFEVELVENDNSSLSPKINGTVNISVAHPSIEIMEPPNNSILYGGMMDIKAGVENFTLTSDFGGNNVNGEGHWHVYINDVLQNPYSGAWANFTGLPAGDHEVKVDLRNNDHSAISPAAEDMIDITVVEEMPAIMVKNHPMHPVGYGGNLDLNVGVENFTLTDDFGMANVAGEGHYHLYINDVMQGMYSSHWLNLTDLPAGDHEFMLELVNNDHSSLMPMVHYQFNVTIRSQQPKIMLNKPMDGHIQYSDDLAVQVMVENFTMNASAIGDDPVPGEGHYHIYINDGLLGPYTDMMTVLEDLPSGDHVIKVELRNNDHSPLVPPVMDMAEFTISGMRPTIDIIEPNMGSIFYRDHLDIRVMIDQFMMNESAIGGMNMAGEGHYHIYINNALVGPYTDSNVTLTDLPAGDHILEVELRNNDHSPVIPGAADMIHFTIVDDVPMIMIGSPMNGSIIYDDMLNFDVLVENFTLNGTAIGGMNMAGEGHYHVYINGDLVGPYAEMMVDLTDLPAGEHVLKVELRNNDHSMLHGPMDHFMDMIHFTISEHRPEIHISHPMDGVVIYSDMIDLHVDIMNYTMNGTAIGGPNTEGEGHYHIYINGDLVGPFNETMVTLEDLPAGTHELKVVLVNNDHSHIMPMEMDMIMFTLMDQRPSISLIEPMDGAYFYGGDLDIEVIISDLTMNDSAIGGNNTPGEGHWHLYINGGLVGPYTETVVSLSDLPVGHHQIEVELRNNDHTPLMPATSDSAEFHLLAIPSIEIVAPSNGTTLDGKILDLELEVTDFILNGSAIDGTNMPGEGHYHIYLNEELVGPYSDLTVTLSDLPAGDHVLKVELRNNDHSPIGVDAMDMLYFTVEEESTEITISFGPVLYDGEPLEGATVEVTYDGETLSGMTGADGMVTFTAPVSWNGMNVDYKVMKDDHEDLEGSGTVSGDGMITVSGDLEVEKKDDDDSDPMIWIIVIVLIVIVLIALFIILRPKEQESYSMEE